MRNRNKILWFVLMAVPAIQVSCDRDRRHPGWDYFPDMFYSTAYETFSRNPNFADGMTMRVPEMGSVARGYIPFNYTNDPESRIKAGKELVNLFPSTEENLTYGRYIYTTFCIDCHGAKGDGNGYLFTSGLYLMKPRSLTDSTSVALKDGELYHTITLGIRSMGSYGSQIAAADRWKMVLYIRELQKNGK